MIGNITKSLIFSKLESSTSLLPMAVKDGGHMAGMTASSYIAGDKVEGKDRFIDELGSQVIWLGGIPFFKKIIDLTLYKAAKFNPNLDVRVLKDPEILKKAIKHAPTEEIKKSIIKASENAKKVKGLAMAKFIASTLLTLGSYSALTTFRHKHTEKAIIEELKKEEKLNKDNQEFLKDKKVLSFKAFQKQTAGNSTKKAEEKQNKKTNGKNPSFGMNFNPEPMKDFMFNPIKNMMIVDGGITAERLADSRNPQDFFGYVIKEGSFWAFMYFASKKIQTYFEKQAEKKHNKSIDLDIKVLQNKEFQKALKTGNMTNALNEFPMLAKDHEIYEFICSEKGQKNLVVKMLKESGVVKTFKETGKVDTQHFIDIKNVKEVHGKMNKVFTQMKEASKAKNFDADKFINKTLKLKNNSILKNIGLCVGVLGFVVPGAILAMRLLNKDNKEFQVKKEIQEKMKNQNLI